MHGGVVPWWLQGSSETYIVALRARSPAAASATTSAWRPLGSVAPSPTTSPSLTTTAPTVGFGYARFASVARQLDRAGERHASASTSCR